MSAISLVALFVYPLSRHETKRPYARAAAAAAATVMSQSNPQFIQVDRATRAMILCSVQYTCFKVPFNAVGEARQGGSEAERAKALMTFHAGVYHHRK